MRNTLIKIYSVVITILCLSNSCYATELTIEHVANAGVRIVSNKNAILVDALFNTNKYYNYVNDTDFKLLNNKNADIALVTHSHGIFATSCGQEVLQPERSCSAILTMKC